MDFESLRNELKATLYEAGQCLHYWRCYNHPETFEANVAAMNRFPWFFQVARGAFLTTALLDLCKLYEERRDSLSLPTFVRAAECQRLVQPEKVADARKVLAEAAPLHKRVKLLRNKVFAHRNTTKGTDAWFAEASVTPNELFQLRNLAKQIFNLITSAYDRSSDSFNLDGPNELLELLDILRTRR